MSRYSRASEAGLSCPPAFRPAEGGSITAWISALLLVLSAATAVAFHALDETRGEVRAIHDRAEQAAVLSRHADAVVRRLEEDGTPLADSTHDRVWEYMRALSQSHIEATLEDLSWLPEECPFIDIGIAPPGVLEELFRRHGIDAATARKAARTATAQRHTACRSEVAVLAGRFGGSLDAILPLLKAEPMVNVNLAPEHTLSRALAQQLGSPEPVSRVLADLLSMRETAEIDQRSLDLVLSGAHAVGCQPQRLGVRTWVWKLTVSNGEAQVIRTLARVEGGPGGLFVTIGDRFDLLRSSTEGSKGSGIAYVR